MNAVMISLTHAQKWLKDKAKNIPGLKPPILENDIDGAFNGVLYDRLTISLKHFGIYENLTNTIESFRSHQTIRLEFDGQRETPAPFESGLPQGSPLSAVLFVIDTTVLSPAEQEPLNRHDTSYVDDKLMTQEAASQKIASKILQQRLDVGVKQAIPLNIKFMPSKGELMHLHRATETKPNNQDTKGVTLYDFQVGQKEQIQALEVCIDKRLSFKSLAAAASSTTRRSLGLIW